MEKCVSCNHDEVQHKNATNYYTIDWAIGCLACANILVTPDFKKKYDACTPVEKDKLARHVFHTFKKEN